jgi:membrane protease subunit HflK
MSDQHQHHHDHSTDPVAEFDPANQSLADALRKSFRVLKFLMFVLVILYFLSGFFTVKSNEVGLKLRYGRVVGTGEGEQGQDPTLGPGWHWSWPYPFERFETVSTNERELPVEFMFQLTEAEQATGISGYKYDALSPERDDYLITGDVNILHASLILKYHVSDAVAYVTNIKPAADLSATSRSREYRRYPEYTLLMNLVRDVVIETAARRQALSIRGTQQSEFLSAVASGLIGKLKEFDRAGTPLGLALDPATGVIAPKSSTIEAIMPPRQTQEVFDKVLSAQSEMAVTIKKAESEAQSTLFQTAGPEYRPLSDAIEVEFDLMFKVAAAPQDTALARQMVDQRTKTEALLQQASGEAQSILRNADIRRDQLVKEAEGDFNQYTSLLPEYLRNPEIFLSRLRQETFAAAMSSDQIQKTFVPRSGQKFWLQIARDSKKKPAAPKPTSGAPHNRPNPKFQ